MPSATWILNKEEDSQFILILDKWNISAFFWRRGKFVGSNALPRPHEEEDLQGQMNTVAAAVFATMALDELAALSDSLNKKMTKLDESFKKCTEQLEKLAGQVMVGLEEESPGVLAWNFKEMMPEIETYHDCPDGDHLGKYEATLFDLIMHLNDDHKWTREAIADWLETLDADLTFKVES